MSEKATPIDRLVAALIEANAPRKLVNDARAGVYDCLRSPSATPILNLIRECRKHGLYSIAERAINGEFEPSKTEAAEGPKL